MSGSNDEFIVVCGCGSGFWVSESGTRIRVDLDNGEIVVSAMSNGDGGGVATGKGDVDGDGDGHCSGGVDGVGVKVSDDKAGGSGSGGIDCVLGVDEIKVKESSSHDSSCRILGLYDNDLDPDWVFGGDDDYYPLAKAKVPCTCSTDESDPLWCCFWGRKSVDVIEISSDEEVSSRLKSPKKERN